MGSVIIIKTDEIERKSLNRFREKLGISRERAIEIENQYISSNLENTIETEYINEYLEILSDGEISEKGRRILIRVAERVNISKNRISELEKNVKK